MNVQILLTPYTCRNLQKYLTVPSVVLEDVSVLHILHFSHVTSQLRGNKHGGTLTADLVVLMSSKTNVTSFRLFLPSLPCAILR